MYPPPYLQEVWHYKDANTEIIRRAIKVDIFNSTIINVLSNSIPHKFLISDDKDPPWFNKKINALIQVKMLHLKIVIIIVVTLI